MIRPGALLTATALAVSLPGAAGAAAPAAQGAPSQAQLDRAAFHLKVLISALQSKDVDAPIKNVLFVCLYENPFGQISDATAKVLAENKLDPKDANKVLTVLAGVCGLRPGASPPPAGAAPKSGPQEKPSR